MTRNKLEDLNNLLFEQLERLSDDELTSEGLQKEVTRTKAITTISTQIIKNAAVALSAQRFVAETLGKKDVAMPQMLESKSVKVINKR